MTRGKFVLVTKERKILASTEFNGDMYVRVGNNIIGHGREVVERLARTETVDDFEKEIREFDKENFQYYDESKPIDLFPKRNLNFMKDYFGYWFNDYLYVKNASAEPISATVGDVCSKGKGTKVWIEPGEIGIFHFGHLFGKVKSGTTEIEFIDPEKF